MRILKEKYSLPIEREYESWIVNEIEKYFRKINLRIECFAISPALEKIIPSDDFFSYNGVLIGLQMKRVLIAKRKNGKESYDRIYWDLTKPIGQFQNIIKHPEIYYCLPTFVNREFKKSALHHCLFWRPNSKTTDKILYYDNNSPRVKTQFKIVKNEMRWGLFIEEIFRSNIGKPMNSKADFERYFKNIVSSENKENDIIENTVFCKIEDA